MEDKMNHHHHHHHAEEEMPFAEKMEKLLQHWIKHNVDHAQTYRDWKAKAEQEGLVTTTGILEDAASAMTDLNQKLEQALQEIASRR